MSDKCAEESFLKDVTGHKLNVIRSEGVYRHIQFRKPGTGIMGFELITWPGYLCYSGDMGTYVFQRLNDMFQFFRTDRQRPGVGQKLNINPSYWAEKVQAEDRDRVTLYSSEIFQNAIEEHLNEIEASDALREAVEEDILSCDENERDARDAVSQFKFDGKEFYPDFWECDLQDYTYRYLWCCYAIAWGVKKYDEEVTL